MTVWVVRAGRYGEREEQALEGDFCVVGWGAIPDLTKYTDKAALRAAIENSYPDSSPGWLHTSATQLWSFVKKIKKGDIIALPLKNRPAIAFGEATGEYIYQPDNPEDLRHMHRVRWIKEPVLRKRLDQDLRYSFGASQTVFSVRRNDAEERIRAMLYKPSLPAAQSNQENQDEETDTTPNLLDAAEEQISDYIGRKFKGRKMEVLVEAILKAKGYETNLCPEGADGGVDILAGMGAMGFDHPRLCVQVKSGDSSVGREVLDQLKGVMQDFKAEHGLLVSWGGFKSTVISEARRGFFNIRLWNDKKLVQEIESVYEKLPAEIQTELPLQRTWVLVEE